MSAPALFRLHRGPGRLLVSIPHAGTFVPPALAARLTAAARGLPDTDWHVDRLYDFVRETEATLLVATHSRYVIDLNRGPEGGALYPGQAETGLVPAETFDGVPIWAGGAPDAAEVAARRVAYWQPYHDALAGELARIQAQHGAAHLFDAHSIRARVPRLFSGTLPPLSFGTYDGRSASPALVARVMAEAGDTLGRVLDGRFKGGWITRHYGRPEAGVQAIQLEIAQSAYLDEADPAWDPARASALQAVLRRVIQALLRP